MLFGLLKGWEERLDGSGGVVGDQCLLRLVLRTLYREGEAEPMLPHPPIVKPPTENVVMGPMPRDEPVVFRRGFSDL